MFEVKAPIATQRIADLITAAIEGGSGYWCDRFVVQSWGGDVTSHEKYSNGAAYTDRWVAVVKPNDRDEITIGIPELQKGLQLMADHYPISHFADFMEENEDAETADVFLQLVCFGEVVFG